MVDLAKLDELIARVEKATGGVFFLSSVGWFVGMFCVVPLALLAYVMPLWWQYLFVAVAIADLSLLGFAAASAVILALLKALREASHEH